MKRREIMKRIAGKLKDVTTLAVAAALLAFFVLASAAPSLAASTEQGMSKSGKASKTERVEDRIKVLYDKLKITPAQEGLWENVTKVMRENAVTMEALIKERTEKAGTQNAIDDLKSYSAIAESHADGLKKFIPAFEPLYASMSDSQKKEADKLFHRQDHKKANAKAKPKAKAEAKPAAEGK
jgi:protein CpxP